MSETSVAASNKIKIGVSSCLMGQKVRFDGQHKYHWYIDQVLGKYFDYVSICPELEVGMGVPRKSVRLVGTADQPQMIEPMTGEDWTARMMASSDKLARGLGEVSGYIFKAGSPSCGLFRVRIYHSKSQVPYASGRGLFAAAVTQRWPLLPCEDEGRLNDAGLRENFIGRVFAYHRLQTLRLARFRRSAWIDFHQRSKYLLLAHSRKLYTELGRLAANIAALSPDDYAATYAAKYMACLSVLATRKKHSDALMHIFGFIKKFATDAQRQHILRVIEDYRVGIHPLIVPLTLLGHYIEVHQVPYVRDQYYLNPHPSDLSLHSSV